ncbi:protein DETOXIFICATION 43-like isoform X3 [Arachis ipaensis]|uniref:protein DETOXIFICATION 43-like isoform X3 n=1 Tax=Arachis ipaensis TaxID=130454 RepID=UPI0007AF54D9|nr:protein DETOXIFICATION 43-like isoform X3 [Arachis ipaensis]XP_025673691.1 protein DETOXIFICATION 43-like isoform X3 [Arachis hypogaea]QHN97312.1 Protein DETOXIFICATION [Arachis hypogaea]
MNMEESGRLNSYRSKWKMPVFVFFKDARLVFKNDSLAKEILKIAIPAALAVAADPVASLIDTAFIGHLGPVDQGAAGVAIALFNLSSKITVVPLVSITTSFVAEEDTIQKTNQNETKLTYELVTKNNDHLHHQDMQVCERTQDGRMKSPMPTPENNVHRDGALTEETNNGNEEYTNICEKNMLKTVERKKLQLGSASTSLLFATILGIIQAAVLIFADKPLLGAMGLKHGSPMLDPAVKYLRLRSLGAPAMLLSLAMQGIFRGFKDTKTPLYVILFGYALNISLDPLLIFHCNLGLTGAAISHVVSQFFMALILWMILIRKMVLLPPGFKNLQIFRFLKNGGMLLAKVIAASFCATLASSLAARLGAIPMAAFQTCLQVWLTSSLIADGLAVAVQAILACSFAEKDYEKVIAAAARTLQMGFVLGVALSLLVGIGMYFGAGLFSKTIPVLHIIRIGLPFVAATQPINSLAFVFDGVNYGASDFAYSAYSLVMVGFATVASLLILSKSKGFVGIWIALTIFMSLRMFAGFWRMGTGTGPWRFLRLH